MAMRTVSLFFFAFSDLLVAAIQLAAYESVVGGKFATPAKSEDAPYYVRTQPNHDCPEGSGISTYKECKKAADETDRPFRAVSKNNYRPIGCIFDAVEKVTWWNEPGNGKGQREDKTGSICINIEALDGPDKQKESSTDSEDAENDTSAGEQDSLDTPNAPKLKERDSTSDETEPTLDDVITVDDNLTSASRPPVMMFAHGCSTTTAGIHTIQALLQAHGENSQFIGSAELIKALDDKNRGGGQNFVLGVGGVDESSPEAKEVINAVDRAKTMTEKMQIVTKFAKQEGITLTFKNELLFALDEKEGKPLMGYLKDSGVRTFLYTRFNLVDVIKCRVTDFCSQDENRDIGYPVDETGKQSGCGFRGRGDEAMISSSSGDRVWLDPKVIVEALKHQKEKDDEHRDYLDGKHAGSANIGRWEYQEMAAESLMGFEYGKSYDEKGMKRSTHRWAKLLETLGVANADRKLVRKTLLKLDEYPAPRSHKESIINYDEIKAVLQGTEYEDMLREYDHVSYADSLSLKQRRTRMARLHPNSTADAFDEIDEDEDDDEDDQSEKLSDVVRRLGSDAASDGKISSDDKDPSVEQKVMGGIDGQTVMGWAAGTVENLQGKVRAGLSQLTES